VRLIDEIEVAIGVVGRDSLRFGIGMRFRARNIVRNEVVVAVEEWTGLRAGRGDRGRAVLNKQQ
jgi:hypothetical protein